MLLKNWVYLIAKGLSKISIWKPFFLLKRNSRQLLENMAEKEENSWVSISIPLLLFVVLQGYLGYIIYDIFFINHQKNIFSGLLAPTIILRILYNSEGLSLVKLKVTTFNWMLWDLVIFLLDSTILITQSATVCILQQYVQPLNLQPFA